MKKIYFVRHGESAGNAAKVHQSATTPLSEIGLSQAEMVALRFRQIPVDLIIASPYLRAQQTAMAIAKRNKLSIETNQLFQERRGPSQLLGLSHLSEQSKQIREQLHTHLLDDSGTWRYSNEETAHEFVDRVAKGLDFLRQRSEESLVVVCHALILRMFFAKIMHPQGKLDDLYEIYNNFELTNTGISIASFHEEKQKWQMLCINDYSHLG